MSVQGHLRLVAAVDDEGRSHLREQSFSAPVHLGKTFLEDGVLTAHVVNPTAGLLEGDGLDVDVRVEKGARLLLTSPAAMRVHTMKGGQAAVRQKFSVAAGGWMEIWPDLFIPQAAARYEQKTEIRVESGGELIFFEILTPGRVASGESFAFDRLDWETNIFLDHTLIARERYRLSPDTASVYALQAVFPQAYQVNCFVVSENLPEKHACWEQVTALHSDDAWIGCSQLVRGGAVIKMLVRDSLVMREGIAKIRETIYAAASWPMPALRKI